MTRFSRTLAIVLRAIDYSETSQVVHLYTREHGKLHCIAKGSKRAKSPFHGAFDLLGVYDIIRLEKQPGSLDLLTRAENVREFRNVRRDFARFSVACGFAELVDSMTGEALPQPDLFDLLHGGIRRLDEDGPIAETLFSFTARALRILGFEPRLGECGVCGARPTGPEACFSARDGGIVCMGCVPRDPTRLVLRRPAFDAMIAYAAGKRFNLDAVPNLSKELWRAFDYYLRHLLQDRPLKSLEEISSTL